MKYLKFLLLIIVFIAALILLNQNHEAFNTKVIFKLTLANTYETPEITIYLIAFVAFIIGVLITLPFLFFDRIKLKKQINRIKNESREKDEELNSLRNLPITTDNVAPGIQENDSIMT